MVRLDLEIIRPLMVQSVSCISKNIMNNQASQPLLGWLPMFLPPAEVRVGGDDDYEGSRQRLRLFDASARPLDAARREVSFELFETAMAAATAYAEVGRTWV